MNYQDTWLNGKLEARGYRACEERYRVIAEFCRLHLPQDFSVCDIGANMAYFSIRLIEEFNASAMAFEFHQFQRRADIVRKQKTDRLMYINRKILLADLAIMSSVIRFDLCLGLSVLHHVNDGTERWIAAMRKMSRFTIVEMALSDSKLAQGKRSYHVPDGGKIIGYGESHLSKSIQRPIIAFVNTQGVTA